MKTLLEPEAVLFSKDKKRVYVLNDIVSDKLAFPRQIRRDTGRREFYVVLTSGKGDFGPFGGFWYELDQAKEILKDKPKMLGKLKVAIKQINMEVLK